MDSPWEFRGQATKLLNSRGRLVWGFRSLSPKPPGVAPALLIEQSSKELGPGWLSDMLKQLGMRKEDL
jgi:hypothetical protein